MILIFFSSNDTHTILFYIKSIISVALTLFHNKIKAENSLTISMISGSDMAFKLYAGEDPDG